MLSYERERSLGETARIVHSKFVYICIHSFGSKKSNGECENGLDILDLKGDQVGRLPDGLPGTDFLGIKKFKEFSFLGFNFLTFKRLLARFDFGFCLLGHLNEWSR